MFSKLTTLPLAAMLALILAPVPPAWSQQPAAPPAAATPATPPPAATPAPAAPPVAATPATPAPTATPPAAAPAAAAAQVGIKDVAGTWQLVSVEVVEAGKKIELFGANPKGQMVLTPEGRFTLIVTRADLPKYKAGVRQRGTADEFQATVQGSLAYYGAYSVEGGNLVFKIEGSTFPNLIGETQQRAVKVAGDDLSYATPPSKGGGVTTLAWKRVK